MLKRIFSLFLCLALLISAVPVNVFADGTDGGDISVEDMLPEETAVPTEPSEPEYPTDPGTEPPAEYPTDPGTEPTEPPGADTEPVNKPTAGTVGNLQWALDLEMGHLSIWGEGGIPDFDSDCQDYWLAHREDILTIEIAEGVGGIGLYAFQGCSNVTAIYLPRSVLAIFHNAFDGWGGATFHVYTDSTAETVAQELGFPIVYRDAPIVPPTEPVEPPTEPVEPPTEPEDTVIAEGESGSLQWKLTTDGVLEIIGNGNMEGYDPKKPAPWTKYADQITQVRFQGAPYMIKGDAFVGLNITEITIPEGTGYMTYQVFRDCDRLETVHLPASLAWMVNMFHSCDALQNIYIADENPFLYDEDGVALYSRDGVTTLQQYPIGRYNREYTVSEGVHSIGKAAFQFADELCGVTLPQSLENIQEKGFAESGLESITLPENVTYIGYFAFENCSDLKELTFQGDLVGIEPSAFTGVNATAYYPADNDTWTEAALQNYGGQIKWVAKGAAQEDLIAGGEAGSLTWKITKDGLLEIMGQGWMDFYYQNSPAPWTQYASQVTSLKISEGVVFLSGLAFVGLQITEAIIPEGVEYVQPDTFVDCKQLQTVYYPSTAQGMHAVFNGCDALQTICVAEGNPRIYDEDGVGLRKWEDTLTLCQYPIGRPDQAYVVSEGVTHIGTSAFQGADSLKNVTLPQSLQVIQDLGFAETGLESITIPENVTFISYYAFADCASLQELTFTGDLVEIAFGAFDNIEATAYYPKGNATWTKDALQNYGGKITWVPQEGEEILEGTYGGNIHWHFDETSGTLTFSGKGKMEEDMEDFDFPWNHLGERVTKVVAEDGVGSLATSALGQLSNLTALSLGKDVAMIGDDIFFHNSKLAQITVSEDSEHYFAADNVLFSADGTRLIYYPQGKTDKHYTMPDSVTVIEVYAFYGCKNLEQITLSKNLKEVLHSAFDSSGLTSVEFPEGVTKIYPSALQCCGELTSVTLPGGLQLFGGVHSCVKLETVHFLGSAPETMDKNAFYKLTVTAYYPANDPTWTADKLQNYGGNVTWIPRSDEKLIASGEAGSLTWKVTEGGLLEISGEGWMPFYYEFDPAPWTEYADKITSLKISEGVEFVSGRAFENLRITEATLPEGLTYVQPETFYNCDLLETVYYPSTALGMYGAFYSCDSLKNIYVAEGNPHVYDLEGVGYRTWENTVTLCQYPIGRPDAAYVVAEDVTNIGYGAFENAANLKQVTLPQSLQTIEEFAFGSSGLEAVTIPENVSFISYYAFQDCSSLQELTFTGDLVEIAENAFAGVKANAYYPKGNKTWTKDARKNYGGKITWIAREILSGDSCGENARWAFDSASATLTVSGTGAMDGYSNTKLPPWSAVAKQIQTLVVEPGITKIGANAFSGCNALTRVTLPEGLTSIDAGAFSGCKDLKQLLLPQSVTTFGRNVFSGCDQLTLEVYRDSQAEIYATEYGIPYVYHEDVVASCEHENLGHMEALEPTCDRDGSKEYWMCGDCGRFWLDAALTQPVSLADTVIPGGHNLVHVPYKRPTETQDGNKEYWYCTRCIRVWTDPDLNRESSFNAVVIPAGTQIAIRPLMLVPMIGQPAQVEENADGSYTVYLDKEDVASDTIEFSIMAEAFDAQGESLPLGLKDLKWSTSDSRIATVKQDKYSPIGNVTVKKGAEGACVITAVNSKTKDETVVTIHVRSYAPRLGSTSLSLNSYAWEGAITDLVPSYGNDIQTVSLHEAQGKGYAAEESQRIVPSYDNVDHQLVLTLNEIVKKGTHKLLLKAHCENGETYEYKLTLKVTQTLPTVTLKQIGKFNTFYRDSVARFQVTVKGGKLLWAEWYLQKNPTFRSDYDPETGILTLYYSDSYLAGTVPFKAKGTIEFQFEDYRLPVEKSVTVKTEKKAPKLALSESSTVINTAITDDYYTGFLVYELATGEIIPGEYIRAEASFADCYVNQYDIVDVQLYGKKGGTVNVYVRKDNWMESVKLSHKVTLKTQLPSLVLSQKTFRMNTNFTDTLYYQSMWLDQSNVLLSDYYVEIVGKSEAVLDEGSKILFQFSDGYIVMKLDPDNLPKKGTYEFHVTGILENGKELASKAFKVTVEDKLPTVKLKNASLKLNKTLDSFAWAETEVTLPKGYEEYMVVGMMPDVAYPDFSLSYDPGNAMLRVDLLNANARSTTLKLHPVLMHLSSGQELVMENTVSLKVTVFTGKPSVTVTAKGKLDAIVPDSAITYTIKKLTNIAGEPEAVALRGEGAELFCVQLLEDGTAVLTIAKDAPVEKNKTYKPELVYTIAGQQVAAKISVKVNQSSMKVAVPKSLNLYQSNARLACVLTVTAPAGASIADIRLSTKTPKQFMNAVEDMTFTQLPDGRMLVSFKIGNPGYLTWGKSYSVYLDVIPNGNAENAKPTTVKLTVKTFK